MRKAKIMHTFINAVTRETQVSGARFVFRELGKKGSVPVIFLHHLTAVLEDWDPELLDGIANKHHVVIFDNRGIGGSNGTTPTSIEEMAKDAIDFIAALGFEKVDLFGFSLGGFVAQAILHAHPNLVRNVILAGTGPAGGEGIAKVREVLQDATARTTGTERHPKHILFFTQTNDGQSGANAYLQRLNERTQDRDIAISNQAIEAQLTAIRAWGNGAPTPLEIIDQPVLVANGDDDVMVPTVGSFELARRIPNARLSIFPNAGHGGIFEHHAAFVPQALAFLRA
jgi:pimeloyl-ACP methyl ester carboxylesterase